MLNDAATTLFVGSFWWFWFVSTSHLTIGYPPQSVDCIGYSFVLVANERSIKRQQPPHWLLIGQATMSLKWLPHQRYVSNIYPDLVALHPDLVAPVRPN